MSTNTQAGQGQDRLGMTEKQWAQWQAYTRGFGEQDENGVDVSLLRRNLRLAPWERLAMLERGLAFFREEGAAMDNNFGRVIDVLNASGLRFVVIGGIAMRLHGSAHLTNDIRFAFAQDQHSLDALATLETDLGGLDLLGEPVGAASFEDLWRGATIIDRQGVPVRVASVDALIAMKRAAGRPKDQAHLLELERLRRLITPGLV